MGYDLVEDGFERCGMHARVLGALVFPTCLLQFSCAPIGSGHISTGSGTHARRQLVVIIGEEEGGDRVFDGSEWEFHFICSEFAN